MVLNHPLRDLIEVENNVKIFLAFLINASSIAIRKNRVFVQEAIYRFILQPWEVDKRQENPLVLALVAEPQGYLALEIDHVVNYENLVGH